MIFKSLTPTTYKRTNLLDPLGITNILRFCEHGGGGGGYPSKDKVAQVVRVVMVAPVARVVIVITDRLPSPLWF